MAAEPDVSFIDAGGAWGADDRDMMIFRGMGLVVSG
jgi:hypothetical protein